MTSPTRQRYWWGARLLCAATLTVAALGGCAHKTGGRAVYGTALPPQTTRSLNVAELQKFFPTLAEFGKMLDSTQLHQDQTYTSITPLEEGRSISDAQCVSLMSAGLESTYDGSKYQGAYGLDASDDQSHFVEAIAVAFPAAVEAQKFVDSQLGLWRQCTDKTFNAGVAGRPPLTFMVDGLIRSDGVPLVVRVQEGGQGFACGRDVEAGSNVVADVMVCNIDKEVVAHRVGAVVNLVLQKLPR